MGDQATKKRRRAKKSCRRWSDLHPDLLAEIFKLLHIVDYIRSLSVCTSWRSVPAKTLNCCRPKEDRQLPLLLISTPNEPHSRCFYRLGCFHNNNVPTKYVMNLPHIAGRRCVGSSQGFLITVDDSNTLCALNPLTGATFPLPPTLTHPDLLLYHPRLRYGAPPRPVKEKVYHMLHKAVISPSLDVIAVVFRGFTEKKNCSVCNLAFARAGDASWTALMPPHPSTWGRMVEHDHIITDIIFHTGSLHALHANGRLSVFDLQNPTAPPTVSPKPGPRCWSPMFLAQTPDREDLLLLWMKASDRYPLMDAKKMKVFKLDKSKLQWIPVQTIGDAALFFGGSYVSSFSTRDFPSLQRNSVYFTSRYINCPLGNVDNVGIYDLEDGRIQLLNSSNDLPQLHWPPPIWFTPTL